MSAGFFLIICRVVPFGAIRNVFDMPDAPLYLQCYYGSAPPFSSPHDFSAEYISRSVRSYFTGVTET